MELLFDLFGYGLDGRFCVFEYFFGVRLVEVLLRNRKITSIKVNVAGRFAL